jgi:hypothetical protein
VPPIRVAGGCSALHAAGMQIWISAAQGGGAARLGCSLAGCRNEGRGGCGRWIDLNERAEIRSLFQILTGRYPLANVVKGSAGNIDEQCTQVLISGIIGCLTGEEFM